MNFWDLIFDLLKHYFDWQKQIMLPGFENVSVIKPAYAVEYDSVCALELDYGLMTKKIKGLF